MQAESSQKPTWSIQKALVPLAPSTYRPAADLFTQTRFITAHRNNIGPCETSVTYQR